MRENSPIPWNCVWLYIVLNLATMLIWVLLHVSIKLEQENFQFSANVYNCMYFVLAVVLIKLLKSIEWHSYLCDRPKIDVFKKIEKVTVYTAQFLSLGRACFYSWTNDADFSDDSHLTNFCTASPAKFRILKLNTVHVPRWAHFKNNPTCLTMSVCFMKCARIHWKWK